MFEDLDLHVRDADSEHFTAYTIACQTVKCTAPIACRTVNCTDPCGWTFVGC